MVAGYLSLYDILSLSLTTKSQVKRFSTSFIYYKMLQVKWYRVVCQTKKPFTCIKLKNTSDTNLALSLFVYVQYAWFMFHIDLSCLKPFVSSDKLQILLFWYSICWRGMMKIREQFLRLNSCKLPKPDVQHGGNSYFYMNMQRALDFSHNLSRLLLCRKLRLLNFCMTAILKPMKIAEVNAFRFEL